MCHWDGTAETEAKIKEDTKATIRCIPLNQNTEEGNCMVTGEASGQSSDRQGLLDRPRKDHSILFFLPFNQKEGYLYLINYT